MYRLKKHHLRAWIMAALLLGTPLLIWAFASDPPLGHTGAPGESTCAACHSGGAGGGNVKIVFSGGGATYIPGTPQTLTITVNDPNNTTVAWGFEMTALEGTVAPTPGTFAAAGTNVSPPETCMTLPSLCPSSSAFPGRVYEEQSSDTKNTFSVSWTPPASSVYSGPVTFYVASTAGDGVLGQKDSVYTANYTLTLAKPNLTLMPSMLTFNYLIGGPAPTAQSVSVGSSGAALSYTVKSSTNSGGGWLSAIPASSTTPASESVSANPTGLLTGTYTGSVSIASAGAANSPQTVAVTLKVTGTAGDFDADGKADYAVWRPSNGTWFVIPSKTPSNFLVQQWGVSGDIPVRGDYDGDGKTDFAVFRPSTGTWYVILSSNPGSPIVQQWGTSGDIPVPGDYDGDGKTDFAVFRPSTGTWYVIPSSNPGSPIVQQWGASGDIPVPGDYNGDGKTDFAVWRPSTGTWFMISASNLGSPIVQQWGTNGDMPVPGDYDGDGKDDFAVWRPSTGTWFIIPTSNPASPIVRQWGTIGDIPVPVDYDGDGETDIAVWRPSDGTWYVIPSSAPTTFTSTQWGTNGDVPIQKPVGQ